MHRQASTQCWYETEEAKEDEKVDGRREECNGDRPSPSGPKMSILREDQLEWAREKLLLRRSRNSYPLEGDGTVAERESGVNCAEEGGSSDSENGWSYNIEGDRKYDEQEEEILVEYFSEEDLKDDEVRLSVELTSDKVEGKEMAGVDKRDETEVEPSVEREMAGDGRKSKIGEESELGMSTKTKSIVDDGGKRKGAVKRYGKEDTAAVHQDQKDLDEGDKSPSDKVEDLFFAIYMVENEIGEIKEEVREQSKGINI